MNCDSTRNSVQGLQSVILLINDTSSSSSSIQNGRPNSTHLNRLYVIKLKLVALYNRQNSSVRGNILPLSKKVLNSSTSNSNGYRAYLRLNYDCFTVCLVVFVSVLEGSFLYEG